jgi:hypothetical protein
MNRPASFAALVRTIACLILGAIAPCGVSFGQKPLKPPEEIQKKLDYFIGDWTGVWEFADRKVFQKDASRRWMLDGRFALITGSYDGAKFHAVTGWDAASGKITDWIFVSDGTHLKDVWTVAVDGELFTLKGQSEGVTGDGKRFTAEKVARIVGRDKFLYEATNVRVDGRPAPGYKWTAVRGRK